MEPYHIRAATAVDQPQIKALVRAVRINPIGLRWQRFVVAVDDAGHLIGCGQIKHHRDGSRELASIAVQKEWRKQGVARALIEALVQTQNGPLWLTCMNPLVPFYKRFGFIEVTAADAMPPYFRLAVRFFRLYQRLMRIPGYLAVMVHHPLH